MNKPQEASVAQVSKPAPNDTNMTAPDDLICPASSIFDAVQTRSAIDAANATLTDPRDIRRATVDILTAAQKVGRDAIQTAFEAAPFDARPTTRAYSYLTDQLVGETLHVATLSQKFTAMTRPPWAATGAAKWRHSPMSICCS